MAQPMRRSWRNAGGLRPDSEAVNARDPRREAQALVGDGLSARVLEPSPPAVTGEWLADDPVNAPAPPGVPVVSPIPVAGLTWAEWVSEHPGHAGWAQERWLGPHRRLTEPGAAFAETRLAVHRLAVYVISPARRRANGRIGLRWTLGGLGTPFFGDDEQVRLQDGALVRQRGATASAAVPATLAAGGGVRARRAPRHRLGRGVRRAAAGRPGGRPPASTLSRPRCSRTGSASPTRCSRSFAPIPARAEPAGSRSGPSTSTRRWTSWLEGAGAATFGASPGDAAVAEPYLYALPPDPGRPPGTSSGTPRASGARSCPSRASPAPPTSGRSPLAFLRERRDALPAPP